MNARIERISTNYSTAGEVPLSDVCYDIVFVINVNSRGWILDKICKVIANYSGMNCYFLYSERNDHLTLPLPRARAYFFAHYSLAFWAMIKYPQVFDAAVFLYFTHFDSNKGISTDEIGFALQHCNHIITMNSTHERALLSLGIDPSNVTTVLAGADPDMFKPHTRKGKVVGFVGAYYPRKQPERVMALIKAMPKTQFLLVAPGPNDVENSGILWSAWDRFEEFRALPNLTYVEAPYEDYPKYYKKMDVYVSLSDLEGGPIPVIESMMANVIPLSTRTGFAEDVLTGPLAKYVLDISAPIEDVVTRVASALKDVDTDVSELGRSYSWESFAHRTLELMKLSMPHAVRTETIPNGEAVSFSLGQKGRSLLGAGWHSVSESGAHSSAERAEITFKTSREGDGFFRIELSASLHPSSLQKSECDDRYATYDIIVDGVCAARNVKISETPIECILITKTTEFTERCFKDDYCTLEFVRQTLPSGVNQCDAEIILHSMKTRHVVTEGHFGLLEFTREQNNSSLMFSSWHVCEEYGTWSDGPEGSICFFVKPHSKDRKLKLRIKLRSLGTSLPDGKALIVSLFDGIETRTVSEVLENDGLHTLELDGPEIPQGEDRMMTLKLKRNIAVQPKTFLSDSTDERQLGVYLCSVEISESALDDQTEASMAAVTP